MNTTTIGEVIREENTKLASAMKRDGMEVEGDLRSFGVGPAFGERYIWLGGFDRFAKVRGVNRDWWVTEGNGWMTSSWCCTPDTPTYRKV